MFENVVIVDANFILLPFQFKIDYLNELVNKLEGYTKFIFYQQVIDELKAKERRNLKASKFIMQFKAGLSYLERFKEKYDLVFDKSTKNNSETTDEFLLKKCVNLKQESRRVFLATNDSELRKNAKISGINVVYLRQKKFLSIE